MEDDNPVAASADVTRSRTSGQREPPAPSSDAARLAYDNSQIVIDLDIIGGMTYTAYERYKDCIGKFAGALAREASRLEEAERAEEIEMPEITATMVIKANDLIRHPPNDPPPTSIPILIAQAVAFAAAMMTPIFGAALHSVWQWTVTVLCGILAVVAQVFAIIAVRRR